MPASPATTSKLSQRRRRIFRARSPIDSASSASTTNLSSPTPRRCPRELPGGGTSAKRQHQGYAEPRRWTLGPLLSTILWELPSLPSAAFRGRHELLRGDGAAVRWMPRTAPPPDLLTEGSVDASLGPRPGDMPVSCLICELIMQRLICAA